MTADTSAHSESAGETRAQFIARFETTVTDADRKRVAEAIAAAIANLRGQIEDDRLERVLRADPGSEVLRGADTHEHEGPESFTQRAVIEVLLEALGYDDLSREPGDYSEGVGKRADYSMRFEEEGESNRLLIEAEPIGKPLDSRKHGIGQVKSWLSRREFESDFGFATDGLRWVFVRYDPDTYTHNVIARVDLGSAFVAAFEAAATGGTPADAALAAVSDDASSGDESVDGGGSIGGGDSSDRDDPIGRDSEIDRLVRTFDHGNFLAIARDVRAVVKATQQAITDDFYDDYIRYVFGITDDDSQRARSLIGDGVLAPADASGDDVRLFAVELMNRLLFVKFLEDKGVVRSDLLRTLRETHDEGVYPGTLYETFLEPLFYGVFDRKPEHRTERIRGIELFEAIPYLNGGLFRPRVEEGGRDSTKGFDERAFDVRDTVCRDVIDLLERYDFSADGGPTDLDPSVLGNVFEKTINYITTDPGNRNKELGAYYTPDEITRFCAERTVRPGLCDRFKEVLRERGWNDAEIERHEELDSLLDDLPPSKSLADDLLSEVDSFRALDPACGSGHFLTSVLAEIVGVRKSLCALRGDDPDEWLLRKETITQNVYGVDIVEPAVEIAKLRLWLSIIAEVDPEAMAEYDAEDLALPNVAFNVRQGNSLIGFTDLMETRGANGDGGQQAALTSWGPDSVRAKYGTIITLVAKHKRASGTDEATDYLQQAEALLEEYRVDLDEKVVEEFHEAGIEDATLEQVRGYEPFHWVLEFAEAYADGGFDVVVGNPPWDRIKPLRDDFFVRYDERFRTLMPEAKDERQAELLEKETITEGWEAYKDDIRTQAEYFNHGGTYELQRPTVAGRTEGTENDLSALFLERVFNVAREDGYVAQVLPGTIFTGTSGKDLRMHLLDETTMGALVQFMNHGIFEAIDTRYKFAITVFENSGRSESVSGLYREGEVEVLEALGEAAVEMPRHVLEQYSPEARIFPLLKSSEEVEFLSKILNCPPIAAQNQGSWHAKPYAELHRTNDTDRFIEDRSAGEYPVYGGSNVYQFIHDSTFLGVEAPKFWSVDGSTDLDRSAKQRIKEKRFRHLKRAIYDAFDGTGSQKSFVNDLLEERRGEPLTTDDVLLDCTEYRIVYRDVTSATNEQTLVAAVIPPGIVCHNTLHTVEAYEITPEESDLAEKPLHSVYERVFEDRELFVALGLINSIAFNSLLRTKVDTHIVMYKFEESQVPRLTDGDDWFHYIAERAARLNCYGEAFAEMRDRLGGIEPATEEAERRQLQAEIDAAAFHAYGLDREETAFVLDDFHRVQNPRVMDEAYFESVLEYYDELAKRGPQP